MKFRKIYVHFIAVKPVLKPMALLDKCFLPLIQACSHDICPRGGGGGGVSSIGSTGAALYIVVSFFFKKVIRTGLFFGYLFSAPAMGFRWGLQKLCWGLL